VLVRAIRTTTISILAIGLLAGSAVGVAAQDATVFTWDPTPGEEPGTATIEASDPRASGALTIGLGEALVTDELVLGTFSLRLANDDGAWTGTGMGFGGDETQSVDIWELTGEAGYDGLSLFTFDGEGIEQPWGVIVATDAIPPVPEPPAE
jgi:hypothetical protein